MAKINSFRQKALLLSASLTFHTECSKTIGEYDSVKNILGPLWTQYNDNIAAQQSATGKNMHLTNTEDVKEKDNARDAYFKMFVSSVDNFQRSPDAAQKANAKTVSVALSRFRGLDKYEMKKETSEIDNMIIAMREPNVYAAITALKLDTLLEDIADANQAFRDALDVRYEGELKKDKNVAGEQRKLTEATYLEIVEKLNAFAIAAPTEDLNKCIDRLNVVIDDYSRTISHMRAGGSGNEKLPKKEVEL